MTTPRKPDSSASADHQDEDTLDVPEWHKHELDRRLALHQQNPDDVLTWEEVKARLLNRA